MFCETTYPINLIKNNFFKQSENTHIEILFFHPCYQLLFTTKKIKT